MMVFLKTSLLFAACVGALGHVILYDPPQRSSIWRHRGMDKTGLARKNPDDFALYCGGMRVQHGRNGGKCGVCGDAYDPRPVPNYPHQYPGIYSQGIISGCYPAESRTIDVVIWIRAYHKGYFEFRLCANNDYTRPVTQECLDQHLLTIETGQGKIVGTRYQPPVAMARGRYKLKLVLPPGMKCTQCVLQFIYNAGNSWGCSAQGVCGVGLGDQEQFWNCADISILPSCEGVVGNMAPDATLLHASSSSQEEIQAHTQTKANAAVAAPTSTEAEEEKAKTDEKARAAIETQAQEQAREDDEAQAGADTQAQARADAESQTKDEAQAGDDDEVQARAESQTRGEAEADSQARAEAQARADAEAQARADAEAHVRAEAQARADAEAQARADAEAQTRAEAQARAAAEAQARTDAEFQLRADAEEGTGPQDGSDADLGTSETDEPTSTAHTGSEQCRGSGPWHGNSDMDNWCRVNCALNNCPTFTCVCD